MKQIRLKNKYAKILDICQESPKCVFVKYLCNVCQYTLSDEFESFIDGHQVEKTIFTDDEIDDFFSIYPRKLFKIVNQDIDLFYIRLNVYGIEQTEDDYVNFDTKSGDYYLGSKESFGSVKTRFNKKEVDQFLTLRDESEFKVVEVEK